jgi:hypothetical protein
VEKVYRYGVVEGGRTGKKSLHLSGDGVRIHAFANGVPVDRTKRYVLRGYVRYEGDVDGTATIKFNYRKGGTNYNVDEGHRVSLGAGDWQFMTKTDRADEAPEADMIWVSCKLEGNGKAWFDDLELIAYDKAELAKDFDQQHGKHNQMIGQLDFERWVGVWDSTNEYKPTVKTQGQTQKGELVSRTLIDDEILFQQWTSDTGDGMNTPAGITFGCLVPAARCSSASASGTPPPKPSR